VVVVAISAEGIFRSTDEGVTWEQLVPPKGKYTAVAVEPGGLFYLTGDGVGMLRSIDSGVTWIPENQALTDLSVLSLALDDRGRIVVGTRDGGVFRTSKIR
jgi:photosystem II stability/assembly factor-like uncharacterized protein